MSAAETSPRPRAAAGDLRRRIEDEIDEEFALHLDLIEQELAEQGVPRDQARERALARFGNTAALREQCRRIAMKEQIVLQRINTVALVLVVVAGVLFAVRMERAQDRQIAAVQAIAENLRPPLVRTSVPANAPPPGVVHIGGGVRHPGAYAIQGPGFSLRRLLIAAGGYIAPPDWELVIVHADGTSTSISAAELAEPAGPDPKLVPGDRVEARSKRTPPAAPDPADGATVERHPPYAALGTTDDGVPKVYNFVGDKTTLRGMLAALGTPVPRDRGVDIMRGSGALTLTAEEAADPAGADPLLQDGDLVLFR